METTLVKSQTSKPRSPDISALKRALIRAWIVRFALNADKPLSEKEQAVYCSMWEEAFSDVDGSRLEAAFVACLRSHTFKTMPTIGDIRQHLSKAEANAAQLEAEQKWEQVRAYAVRLSPDFPDRKPPNILARTMTAIRAAGGLAYIRDCDPESLQWARKRFIEAYLRYGELRQDSYLLPAGEVRDQLVACAEQKQLPGEDNHKAARATGENYREHLSKSIAPVCQLAASSAKTEPRPMIDTPERRELLKRQQGEILAKSSPEEIRKAEELLRQVRAGNAMKPRPLQA
jgi:hypothetical protein